MPQIIVQRTIGGSYSDTDYHRIGNYGLYPGATPGGVTPAWSVFTDRYFTDYSSAGYTRFWLHEPFGLLPSSDTNPQTDQLLFARRNPLLDHVTGAGFISAITPYTSGGKEVICYLGGPPWCHTLNRLARYSTYARWCRHAHACIAPLIAAGCSVCFDAVFNAEEDGWLHRFLENLSSRGTRVYLEGWPFAGKEHLRDFGRILTDSHVYHLQQETVFDGLEDGDNLNNSTYLEVIHYNTTRTDYWVSGTPPGSDYTTAAMRTWMPPVNVIDHALNITTCFAVDYPCAGAGNLPRSYFPYPDG